MHWPLAQWVILQWIDHVNYDPELFRADLSHIPWDIIELESDPDNAWNSFKDLFMTLADCNAPVVNRRVRGRSLPWITLAIKKARLSAQKSHYYSFKIFSWFWLAKRARSIHHNQLLMTKFGRISCLTRKWLQKCSVFAG